MSSDRDNKHTFTSLLFISTPHTFIEHPTWLDRRSIAQSKRINRTVRTDRITVLVICSLVLGLLGGQVDLVKFPQNSELRELLIRNGGSVMVEVSPVDPVCGIGLAQNVPAAQDLSAWKGLNLLGFALMQGRDQLASHQAPENVGQSRFRYRLLFSACPCSVLCAIHGSRRQLLTTHGISVVRTKSRMRQSSDEAVKRI
ncbi:MAG: hypothetical protein CMK78_15465 [Pseudomonadales bacterium]|nr:hypothetical protein [Pseudomonadales bacterium]